MDRLIVRVIEDRAESGRRVVHAHAAVRAKCTHFGEEAAVAAVGDVTDSGVRRAIRADADAVAHMGNGFPFVTDSKAAQYVPEAHVLPPFGLNKTVYALMYDVSQFPTGSISILSLGQIGGP